MSTLDPELEALVLKQLRHKRKNFRGGGVAMAIVGVVLAGISYVALDPPQQRLWMLCLGMIPFGALFALIGGVGDLSNAKPLEVLRERAADIVWMFVSVRTGRGGRQSHVVMGLRDGTRAALWTEQGTEEATLRALHRAAPHAVVGHSPELEARFLRDPASMRE